MSNDNERKDCGNAKDYDEDMREMAGKVLVWDEARALALAEISAVRRRIHDLTIDLEYFCAAGDMLRAAVAEIAEAYEKRDRAQGAWQVCNEERDRLAAENERLRAALAQMTEYRDKWREMHDAHVTRADAKETP